MGEIGWGSAQRGTATHRQPLDRLAFPGYMAIAVLSLLLLWPSAAFATTLSSTITENMTLTAAGNPYTGTSTIAAGVTVTVEPGVKFSETSLTVKGTLSAEGTAEKPVVFEEDGENAITFEPGSGASVLDHVEMIKAGHEGVYNSSRSAILVERSSPTIRNSTFRATGYYAIQVPNGGSPEIANSSFLNGWKTPIYFKATTEQSGEVNIHGNFIEAGENTKYGGGIDVSVSGSTVTAKTLSGNTVIGTPGAGISYTGSGIPTDVTENTLSGAQAAVIALSGTVASSATWSGGGTIQATSVTIASGTTLAIASNVHLAETSLTVKGTLSAEGTAEKPVVFEEDGENAITFEPGSGASVLDHVEMIKAGHEGVYNSSRSAILVERSSPTIRNSTFRATGYYAIQVPNGGSPEIANSSFLNGWKTPIYFKATTEQSGEVNIHGNFIEAGENTKYGGGIDVSVSGSTVTAKTLSGNTVIGTPGVGLSYAGPDIPGNITENTLSGNQNNVIEVSGTVAHSSTWNDGNSKVKILSATIAAGVTLKIMPGVVLTESKFTVNGTLAAEGTSSEPVVIENNGKTAVTFEPGSGASVLDHVEIIKAGHEACCLGSEPAISIKKSSPRITNSTFHSAGYYAIHVPNGGAPEIANDIFLNGEKTPIYYRASTGETGEINIHDNYLEAGENTLYGGGIDIAVSGSTVTAKTLSGNTVIGTPGVGLSYAGPDIPGNITENTLVGNKSNIIEVGGTVAHSSTWKYGGTLIEITSVTVASGVTLSIAPNVYLDEANFTVNGTLKAEGTSEKPVVFDGTSGSAITFESGSGASVLDHVEVIGAGHEGVSNTSRPAISIKKSSPTITHSVFRDSGYYAIQVPNGGSPEIANDAFFNGEKTPIYYRAASGETGQINIHDNYLEAGPNTKYGGGIDASVSGSTVTAKTLSGNTVIGTPGAGISYTGPDIPGNITETF
jgi:hypothetical protein